MKILILYASSHHGNTKRLVYSLEQIKDLTILNYKDAKNINLNQYDLIGLASGIYYGNVDSHFLEYIKEKLPRNKDIFVILTCGIYLKSYLNKLKDFLKSNNDFLLGIFSSPGYTTYGPFKLIGGVHKNQPNQVKQRDLLIFFKEILEKFKNKKV